MLIIALLREVIYGETDNFRMFSTDATISDRGCNMRVAKEL